MLPARLFDLIKREDEKFSGQAKNDFCLPKYNPETHYVDLTKNKYFRALLVLRNFVALACDDYFGVEHGAKKVDLFIITPSVSSPTGPGSDSEAIPIKFGQRDFYLVDSSQFGFEPLLMNGLDRVYCYLPSMRGEDCDKRHLNQFFHCEAEIKGTMADLIPLVEGYVKNLCQTILSMPNIVNLISVNAGATIAALERVIDSGLFPQVSFNNAIDSLSKKGGSTGINFTDCGRDLSAKGELEIAEMFSDGKPLWVTNYDRDRSPFYHKPDPANPNQVINADLLLPPIIGGSFGGEVAGCGQRQDKAEEILESLNRQGLSPEPYNWYINLRRLPGYHITSGFGLGIERFIAWALCRDDIKDVIIYPRLKNQLTLP